MTRRVMGRRDFLVTSSMGVLGASLLASKAWADGGRRKNVLFIITDDLRPQLGCHGNPQMISPHIDAMAARGTVFNRAYCQYPVCGPSRQSFLGGLRPDTLGVHDNRLVREEDLPPHDSLPMTFRKNGYHTLSVGKVYHNSHHQDLDAWSEKPVALGAHVYNLPENQRRMEEIARKGEEEGWPPEEIRVRQLVAATEDADVPDDAYMPGKHTNIAIEKLRERAAEPDTPFFLALGYFRPHLPFNAPKRYWDMYEPEDIHDAPNPFPPATAPFVRDRNWEAGGYGDVPDEGEYSPELRRRLVHGYYACVSYLDAQIGRLLSELDRLGLRDDTLIVLIGDHGFHLGEKNLFGKFTHFELDAHSPLIVVDPDSPGGQATDALVEFVDIYPSLCELAGLHAPAHLDGKSFAPLLRDPGREWKEAAFTQYHLGDHQGRSMRTDRYRYTRWTHGVTGETMAHELYDLHADPRENENLANLAQYQGLVRELSALFDREYKWLPAVAP